MIVKARREWNTLRVPIGDGPGCVTVRELSMADMQRIGRDAMRTKLTEKTGVTTEEADSEISGRLTIAHYVSGLDGWTVDQVLEVAPLEVGTDDQLDLPEPNAEGVITYDPGRVVWFNAEGKPHNLAEYLWYRSSPFMFSGVIQRVSSNMGETRRALEEAKKKDLPGSSVSVETAECHSPASSAGNGSKGKRRGGMVADAEMTGTTADASGQSSTPSAGTC